MRVSLLPDAGPGEAFAQASRFREDLFGCLTARGDELFDLVDALLCADGPVTSSVDLTWWGSTGAGTERCTRR